jgi:hypothetical protein
MNSFDRKLKEALSPKVIGYILYFNRYEPDQNLNNPDVILDNAITHGEDVAVLFITATNEVALQIINKRDMDRYGDHIDFPWSQVEWRGSVVSSTPGIRQERLATLNDINNAMNAARPSVETPPTSNNKLSDVDEWVSNHGLPNSVSDVIDYVEGEVEED